MSRLFYVTNSKQILHLLNNGTNVNLRNNINCTVLLNEADDPDIFMTKSLIIYGADLNVQDKHGSGVLEEHTFDDDILNAERIYLTCGIQLTLKYKIKIAKELLKKKKYSLVYQILASDSCLAKSMRHEKDENLKLWYLEKYPKYLHGYKKQLYKHYQNKIEKIQYQIYPGEEFIKLIKQDYPHISVFEIFKASLK